MIRAPVFNSLTQNINPCIEFVDSFMTESVTNKASFGKQLHLEGLHNSHLSANMGRTTE
jgi:hypothetical protein